MKIMALEKALQGPPCCDMSDDQNSLPSPPDGEVREGTSDTIGGSNPTLALRVGPLEIGEAVALDLLCRGSIQEPVVTFSKSPIFQDRNVSPGEGDVGGLDSSIKVRNEYRRQPVVSTAFSESSGVFPADC